MFVFLQCKICQCGLLAGCLCVTTLVPLIAFPACEHLRPYVCVCAGLARKGSDSRASDWTQPPGEPVAGRQTHIRERDSVPIRPDMTVPAAKSVSRGHTAETSSSQPDLSLCPKTVPSGPCDSPSLPVGRKRGPNPCVSGASWGEALPPRKGAKRQCARWVRELRAPTWPVSEARSRKHLWLPDGDRKPGRQRPPLPMCS